MGCDIHLYIEYRRYNTDTLWQSFGGRINPGRNYALFTLMAGVRNYNNKQLMPWISNPRGLPNDLGYQSQSDNRLYISDFPGENHISTVRAKNLVESGNSTYICNYANQPIFVTNPDWHSHSWLNFKEYELIIQKYLEFEREWHQQRIENHKEFVKENEITGEDYTPEMIEEPEYQAILAVMKLFEELGYETRIVFWFDN